MQLWTDAVEPQELTTFARKTQAELEAAKGSLAAHFPSEVVDDISVRYVRGANGLVNAAEYRAFDAETSIGSQDAGERITMDLAPVGQKIRIGELDQLHARSLNPSDERVQISVAKATSDAVMATDLRVEALRGSVLETGRLTIKENGFYVDVDLGRDESLTTQTSTSWADEGATPLTDLEAWMEVYAGRNDEAPAVMVVSRKALNMLRRNKQVLSAVSGVASPTIVGTDVLNSVLAANDLPAVQVYDRRVRVGGVKKRVLNEDSVFFLPAPGQLGKTTWGRTAEADDPDYGIAAAEGAGIVAAAHKEHDPYSHWARATAIVLPVMTDPNASMVAKVVV